MARFEATRRKHCGEDGDGHGFRSTDLLYAEGVKASELKRWLEKQGCTFQAGKGGHLKVRLGSRRSVLPLHGGGQEIGRDLEERIKKQLGLKRGK